MIESPVIRLLVLFPLCWGVIAEKRAGGDDRSAPSVSSTSEPGGTPADPPPRLELDREIEQLSDRAAALEQVGKQDELLATQQELIERLRLRYPKSEYPDGHPALVRALERHTRSLFLGAKYDDLEPPAVAALAMIVSLNPTLDADTDRTAYSQIAGRLGKAYAVRKQTAKAKALNAEVVHRLRAVLPKDRFPEGHGDLADHLIIHARFLMADGKWDQAEEELVEARGYFRRLAAVIQCPSVDHNIIVTSFLESTSALNQLYKRSQNHKAKLRLSLESVELAGVLFKASQYPDAEASMGVLCESLATAYYDLGHMSESIPMYKAAVAHFGAADRGDGRLTMRLIGALNNLALAELAVRNYTAAQREISDAVKTARVAAQARPTPQAKVYLASLLNAQGVILAACDQLIASNNAYNEASTLYRSIDVSDAGDFAVEVKKRLSSSLGNLAANCQQLHERRASVEYGQEQVALLRVVYSSAHFPYGHRDLVAAICNLSLCHVSLGEIVEAGRLLDECVMMSRMLDLDRGTIADIQLWSRVIMAVAELRIESGDYGDARALYDEASCILYNERESLLLPRELLISCNCRLAYICIVQGSAKDAVEFAELATCYARNNAGRKEGAGALPLIRSLYYLARSNVAAKRWRESWNAHSEAMRLCQSYVQYHAQGMSEAQCLAFIGGYLAPQASMYDSWKNSGQSPCVLYRELWKTRGVVQKLIAERREVLERIGGDRFCELLMRRREIASSANDLVIRVGERDDGQLALLTREREEIEREFAWLASQAIAKPFWEGVDAEALGEILSGNHAFVDVMILPTLDLSGDLEAKPGPRPIELRYVGFVSTPKRDVQLVDLGSVADVDRVVYELRDSLDIHQAFQNAAVKLSRLIWGPIETRLQQNTQTVWICPEGLLTAVPWGALPRLHGSGIVLESYNVSVVPAGHFVVKQLKGSAVHSKFASDEFLMVGEVDFDQQDSVDVSIATTTRGPLSDANTPWTSLPGTSDEIEGIQRIVAHAKPVVLRHRRATVGRVTEQLPRARWAHFATHGFFANPRYRSILQANQATTGQFEAMGPGDRHGPIARNPLLLSGLVLAGANKRQAGKVPGGESNDCGILTAEAISLLDLDNTDLVVLSACDTGLGDIAGREGVLGLQRAFHLAGVKNVVASLWKVDDEATALLMKEFYRNLAVEKQSPIAALRAAQLHIYRHPELLNSGSRNRGVNFKSQVPREDEPRTPSKSYTPARYWAAFTLSGLGL